MTIKNDVSEMNISTTMVVMGDGIELYTYIIKPTESGKFPTVLIRSPYTAPYDAELTIENLPMLEPMIGLQLGGRIGEVDYASVRKLLEAGYCLVWQHNRGTGNSGGKLEHFLHDYDDGVTTLDWVRRQDFYNEEIYMCGASYLGWNSLLNAITPQKDVKAIATIAPNYWHHEVAQRNGFFKTGLLGYWQGMIVGTQTNDSPRKTNYSDDVFRTFPQKDWGELAFNEPCQMWLDNLNHPGEHDPWWREEGRGHNMYDALEQLDVPTLFIEGWFDLFIDPSVPVWNEIIPEETRKKSAMIVNPYDHGGLNCHPDGVAMDYWPFDMKGADLTEAYPNPIINWFDHVRKGEVLNLVKEGEIVFFPECGESKWYYEDTFNEGEEERVLYLNEGGKVETTQGAVGEITYLYNPYNPAVFYGGTDHNIGFARPGYERMGAKPLIPQDPPNWRYDIVSFEGEPFAEDFTLKGSMSADVYVKSDCEDTSFYARVYLIRDGQTYGIRDDITSLCYQLGDYTPGEEVKLHFDFSHLVWEVQAGDSLRIDITSSCFPMYSLHTNVKGLQGYVEKPKYAHNTVVFGKSTFTYHTGDLTKLESMEIE